MNYYIAFNNFLSTSQNSNVSLEFARRIIAASDLVGVLFLMTVDPSISATPYVNVRNVSYYRGEGRILFCMHFVFRIGEINKIDNSSSLYQVGLKLTADDDQQLRTLTEQYERRL